MGDSRENEYNSSKMSSNGRSRFKGKRGSKNTTMKRSKVSTSFSPSKNTLTGTNSESFQVRNLSLSVITEEYFNQELISSNFRDLNSQTILIPFTIKVDK